MTESNAYPPIRDEASFGSPELLLQSLQSEYHLTMKKEQKEREKRLKETGESSAQDGTLERSP